MPMPQTAWVTPSLLLGRVPDGLPRAVAVSDPVAALRVIGQGGVAVLPAGRWAHAEDVLAGLGLDRAEIADRVGFARGESGGRSDIRLDT